MRSWIRRPSVGSSRLGEKSRSTTERTFLFAVGASFACLRGRPTFLAELGIPIKVPSRTRLQRTIVVSGMSVADQASQCWRAVVEEQGCSLPMRSLAKELELNGWRSRWLVTSVSAAIMEE